MPGSRKPPNPTHPDDVDLSYSRALFVGKPMIAERFIHIDKLSLVNRTFATPVDPMRPSTGAAYRRYTEALNILESGGYDDLGMSNRPIVGPDAADPENPGAPLRHHTPRSKVENEIQAVRISMYFNAEDEALMFATAKNLMAYHMSWSNSAFAEYVIRKTMGIDNQHPYFATYLYSVSKNRDTWQNRVLGHAHKQAKIFIFGTEKGKSVMKWWKSEKIDWISYNEKGRRCLFVIDPTHLIAEQYNTLSVAREVFHELWQCIDEDALEKDGKPTRLGAIIIAKAMSLIQLEITYIFAYWTDFDKARYTKVGDSDHHCRDKELMLAYLQTIDSATSPIKTLKRTVNGAVVETIQVGYLIPMVPGRRYATTRRSGKRQKVQASDVKNVIRVNFDEESDDEEDDDE